MAQIFFDAETTGLFPEGRITCIVTEHNNRTKVWATPGDSENSYAIMDDACIAELVSFMEEDGDNGRSVVSYNGSSFDFKMLAHQATDPALKQRIKTLALNHFDLHLACMIERGHRLKLDGLAKATLGAAKSGSGLDAIKYWRAKEYQKLFEYCQQDVELLRDLYNLAKNGDSLRFESSKGNVFDVDLRATIDVTAEELSKQMPKQQDWMRTAPSLTKVFDWI